METGQGRTGTDLLAAPSASLPARQLLCVHAGWLAGDGQTWSDVCPSSLTALPWSARIVHPSIQVGKPPLEEHGRSLQDLGC